MSTARPIWKEPIRPGVSVVVDEGMDGVDEVVIALDGAIVIVPSPTEWRKRRRKSNRFYDQPGVMFDGMGTYDGIDSVTGDEETPLGTWGQGSGPSRPVWGSP